MQNSTKDTKGTTRHGAALSTQPTWPSPLWHQGPALFWALLLFHSCLERQRWKSNTVKSLRSPASLPPRHGGAACQKGLTVKGREDQAHHAVLPEDERKRGDQRPTFCSLAPKAFHTWVPAHQNTDLFLIYPITTELLPFVSQTTGS